MGQLNGLYDVLAGIYHYPSADYMTQVGKCRELLEDQDPQAAELVGHFESEMSDKPRAKLEELYTRTFDLNPECCPEIGWQLFGEKYDRGAFMVWVRQQLRTLKLDESGELPDHLTNVLVVLARMKGADGDRFAREAVLPSIERMLDSLSEKENPFEHLLQATRSFLTTVHGPSKRLDQKPLVQLQNEMPNLASGE